MRKFFRVLRNLILIGLLAFGVWNYQNNANFRNATNDSVATLSNRISQLMTNGSLNAPTLGDNPTSKSPDSKKATPLKKGASTWDKPEASVYIDLENNPTLRSATMDAINIWNRTGAFTFKQINNKSKAQIVVSAVSESDTSAAGETYTTYNPATAHLLHAKIQLNRFYLQNRWYGYSNARIVNTVEHELGHAIGLSHTNGVSVMYPKGSFYTIQPVDIRAVKKLYSEK